MHGVGTAFSAITIVNALPTGIGCAIGIELPATAEVDLTVRDRSAPFELRIAPTSRTRLVETAVRTGIARYLPDSSAAAEVRLRSEIPVARGLKSSSAVASAVLLAVADAADQHPTAQEIASLSADVGREAGVSATGAFDDALAGLQPGFVVTDNREKRVLRSEALTDDWEVAVLVPPGTHRPSPEWASQFAREHDAGRRAVDAARSGDWAEAMRRNTELVERVMGYDYAPLRSALHRAGAGAAGVSGLGPALAALAPPHRTDEILARLAREPGEHLRVGFVRNGPGAPRMAP